MRTDQHGMHVLSVSENREPYYEIHIPRGEPMDGCTLKEIARGLISLKLEAEGELRYITTMKEVIQLLKEGAEGKIVLVNDGGTTFLAPILSKLAGVVCVTGALGSHLAIVTREFEIPALMGTKIENPHELDRKNVKIEPGEGTEGALFVLE